MNKIETKSEIKKLEFYRSILKKVATQYPGRSIENIVQNYDSRINYLNKINGTS